MVGMLAFDSNSLTKLWYVLFIDEDDDTNDGETWILLCDSTDDDSGDDDDLVVTTKDSTNEHFNTKLTMQV